MENAKKLNGLPGYMWWVIILIATGLLIFFAWLFYSYKIEQIKRTDKALSQNFSITTNKCSI